MRTSFLSPFRVRNRLFLPLILMYLLMNGLAAINAALHDPWVGYDMDNHRWYVLSLARGRLPVPEESDEFFSPPLPYIFPAALASGGSISLWRAFKYAQWLNVLLSLGLTFTLLKICDFIQPEAPVLKWASLALLGMLPVYYKTFAQVRGEPFVAFFAVLAVAQTIRLFHPKFSADRHIGWRVSALGCTLGLIILSRQWGFLLFPALALFVGGWVYKKKSLKPFWRLLIGFGIAFWVGGWFYLYLWRTYGSLTAFNRQPLPFAFSNQPGSFYFDLSLDRLFRDPIRPSFNNRLLPILYADTWGDYWGYFLVYSKDLRAEQRGDGVLYLTGKPLEEAFSTHPLPEWLETNRFKINGYLGRVNLVALLPSGLFFAGVLFGLRGSIRFLRSGEPSLFESALALITLALAGFWGGYLWFLIRYPVLEAGGNNIKAAYLLHVFPFLALLGGSALQAMANRSRLAAWGFGLSLGLVFCHNLPAVITHYPLWSTHLVNLFSTR